MGTYKVIQDIEAEDTIIGWMTPRQAVYAAIVIVSGFISFLLMSNGGWWLAIPLFPHMILFTVLAGPFVHDQPSEVWLLAKIKFFLKPRRRIWDQSGIKELVTITVPKKIERNLTDGLTQSEVKSRLQALANTIDSRGWAIKNVNVNLYAQPAYAAAVNSDRLIDHTALPQQVPDYDTYASDDILDRQNNPVAQQVQQMVAQSAQAHRQQVIAQMRQPQAASAQAPTPQWFVDPAVQASTSVTPQPTPAEEQLSQQIKNSRQQQQLDKQHMPGISPSSGQLQHPRAKQSVDRAVVDQLAQNNDLNISTIARQANKSDDDNEVVVSLR